MFCTDLALSGRYLLDCRQCDLEHQQTAYSAIAVLERMNALEVYMEIEDVFQRLLAGVIVVAEQSLQLLMNLFRWASFLSAYLIRQQFVVTNS